jgi:hypothetical protein
VAARPSQATPKRPRSAAETHVRHGPGRTVCTFYAGSEGQRLRQPSIGTPSSETAHRGHYRDDLTSGPLFGQSDASPIEVLRGAAAYPKISWACRRPSECISRGSVDDAFDLAPVEAEAAGYRTLAVAGVVPGSYRLLHAWRFGQGGWYFVVRDRQGLVHVSDVARRDTSRGLRSDEGHQEFE